VQQEVTSTAKNSNIAALFESLSHQPLLQQPIVAVPSKPECLQYIEVLTIDEKADTLLDLFQYILSLNCYKNIKIIVFVRGFTEERVKQFDNLLGSDMKKVLKKYPDFHRFYACVCAAGVIESNLKSFLGHNNAVLITDVDSRYLGKWLFEFQEVMIEKDS
jgi:GTP1/Obg family GTP-binding protein